jgi:UDP-3-O-[3-hydroxymyristoyl] N-acetylglucosamine deacetylase
VSYLTQKTVKSNISFNGVALHSGLDVNICIKPAEPNFGIVFKRVDLKIDNLVYPNFMNVTNTSLNTTVENDFGVKVSTIEHLMGALFGLGIDNALIEIDNEEVPILDGSAKEFIEKIIVAGVDVSETPIKIIKINKEIKYSEGERMISIKPSALSLEIDFQLKYKNQIIGNQGNIVKVYEDDLTDVYNSRTYCLFEDIGDLYTSGYRIIGGVKCSQGGHYLTNQLLRKVFQNKENFSILEIKEKNLPHTLINKNLLRSIA